MSGAALGRDDRLFLEERSLIIGQFIAGTSMRLGHPCSIWAFLCDQQCVRELD